MQPSSFLSHPCNKLAAAAAAFLTLSPLASGVELETSVIIEKGPGHSDPSYGFEMEYYFTPLAFGSGAPREELPFLERVASLRAGTSWQRSKTRQSSVDESPFFRAEIESEARNTLSEVSAEYVHRAAGSPHVFTVAGGLIKAETKFDFTARIFEDDQLVQTFHDSTEADADGYGVSGGYDYYLGAFWTVGASIARLSLDGMGEDNDVTSGSVRTERLWELPRGQWVGLSGQLDHVWQSGDDQWGWNGQVKYYWNERTGAYADASGDGEGDELTLEVGLSHYFNDLIFARVFGATTDRDSEDFELAEGSDTGWGIAIGARY